ncbi:MAG TPA: response regulator [Kofleriaceae bacterium]|jgi:signal transduction histidine kinase/response regulator RpfG family c-di-GMP phosphodiesterase|nr:response regulator [Kofleriaceae bacterium]
MTITDRTFAELQADSRELYLACDDAGTITYADDRAARLLGLHAGESLRRHVVRGCEHKAMALLDDSRTARVDGCELAFEAHGKTVTASFIAAPSSHGRLLLGCIIGDAMVAALEHVNQLVGEAVDLNRTVIRQRNELVARNRELSDSHQGVVSLLAELQDRADQTQHDSEIKGRLVANLSHELRTPLHSILGLTQLLSNGADGTLTGAQAKQVRFIRSSAEDLLGLVNDVLDLGKLDADQQQLRVEGFDIRSFLASLRGVLRPLVPADVPVELQVIEPAGAPIEVETDRTKLSQIVRNLVSNAIKFTERGEVRVTAEQVGDRIILRVVDTGIGIAPRDHERIFEEYGQIESHLQRRLKGTGLGLPLARKLAARLGGMLHLDSDIGKGATFTLDIPARHEEAKEMRALVERSRAKPAGATSILVVEDDRHSLFLYERYLVMAGFHVLPARTIADAKELMKDHRPAAIVLDVMLEGDSSWSFLAGIKDNPETRDIPVLVVTITNREDKARALGADEFWLKPIDQDQLLRKLSELAERSPMTRVLVIDDDDKARYIIRHHLEGTPYKLFEASNGPDGVQLAREHHPNVILLDFLLGGSTAFDVIDDLKADPDTRGIPVVVVTSHVLDAIEQKRLLAEASSVISKQNLSRELAINRIRDALSKTAAGART